MNITDLSFLLYFLPIMLLVYFALSFSNKARNMWLVICCFVFYAFGNISYMLFLFAMVMINYYLGYEIDRRQQSGIPASRMLVLAVLVNVVPLVVLKYIPATINSIYQLLNMDPVTFAPVPFGIAFLALHGISYTVDIYRGKNRWNPRFTDTALYLTFFPVLQAGPLIRYHEVAEQIENRTISLAQLTEGVLRFIPGLAKVVLLAAPLMKVADIAFELSNNSGVYAVIPVSLALLGLGCMVLGFYHYLSGFSDMVIGLGRMLGFHYQENFNYPILASSMTLFWKRAYSSLEIWFDEYIYQSLSRKRKNNDSMVLHLLLMWILIGFWLGPGLPNLLFGLLSFVCILIERIVEMEEKESRNIFRHLYVLVIVVLSLIALRTDTLYQFTLFLSNLFGMRGGGFHSDLALALLNEVWYIMIFALLGCFPIMAKLRELSERKGNLLGAAVTICYPVAMIAVIALVVITLTGGSYAPNDLTHLQLWR